MTPGHGARGLAVDRNDARVRILAAQERGMHHAVELDVGGIAPGSGQ